MMNLNLVREPLEIMDREVERLKQSRIPIVKIRWNSQILSSFHQSLLQKPTQTELRDEVPFRGEDCHNS